MATTEAPALAPLEYGRDEQQRSLALMRFSTQLRDIPSVKRLIWPPNLNPSTFYIVLDEDSDDGRNAVYALEEEFLLSQPESVVHFIVVSLGHVALENLPHENVIFQR